MPNVTFSFTTQQVARIQEAATLYNAAHGTALTNKEFVFTVCVKPKVVQILRDNAALTSAESNQVSVTSDMETGVP